MIHSRYCSKLPVLFNKLSYLAMGDFLWSAQINYMSGRFKNISYTEGQSCIIVTGTSGISKSVFLIYLIIRHLTKSDGSKPPIIIFHTKGGNSKCYALQANQLCMLEILVILYLEHSSSFMKHGTWWTAPQDQNTVCAKTVISVSPKTLYSDSNECQEVSK